MIQSNTYDFCVPESQRLAELGGVMHDLLTVQEIAGIYLNLEYNRENLTIKNALCASALTTYMRTRQSNGRAGVTQEMIEELSSDLQDMHEYFRQMRNKWVAHPVNEHENYTVTLKVEHNPEDELVPKSIGSKATNTVFLAPPKMRTLHKMAGILRKRILREINKEEERLVAFAQTLDLSKLKEDPSQYSCKDIENPKADKVRKKFK